MKFNKKFDDVNQNLKDLRGNMNELCERDVSLGQWITTKSDISYAKD